MDCWPTWSWDPWGLILTQILSRTLLDSECTFMSVPEFWVLSIW